MQAGARRRLRSIVQDCQRWLSDASNNRFRSQGRQMADRMSDLESFLMNDVEDAIVPEAVLAEMLRWVGQGGKVPGQNQHGALQEC